MEKQDFYNINTNKNNVNNESKDVKKFAQDVASKFTEGDLRRGAMVQRLKEVISDLTLCVLHDVCNEFKEKKYETADDFENACNALMVMHMALDKALKKATEADKDAIMEELKVYAMASDSFWTIIKKIGHVDMAPEQMRDTLNQLIKDMMEDE